jgi:hypothetical protein
VGGKCGQIWRRFQSALQLIGGGKTSIAPLALEYH